MTLTTPIWGTFGHVKVSRLVLVTFKTVAIAVLEIFHAVYNSKSGHLTLATPLLGTIVIDRLGHAMFNLPTKFEVRSITRYGDMKLKCAAKFKKWGSLGG